MKEFNKYFSGLDRDFGFCNIKNGFIEESTGKLKFDPGDYGWSHRSITDQDYEEHLNGETSIGIQPCLLYTSPSPRDKRQSRMPSSA